MTWTDTTIASPWVAAVDASPASVTQRARNAGLPLDRPSLKSRRQPDPPRTSFRRRLPRGPDALDVVEDWAGEVISFDSSGETFVARLIDRRGKQIDRDVRFDVKVIPERLKEELVPGLTFRYLIGEVKQHQAPRLRRRDLRIQFSFEEPAPMTSDDVQSALAEADRLLEILDDD
jgi:hypothetical protein